jgi:hypothetical protein
VTFQPPDWIQMNSLSVSFRWEGEDWDLQEETNEHLLNETFENLPNEYRLVIRSTGKQSWNQRRPNDRKNSSSVSSQNVGWLHDIWRGGPLVSPYSNRTILTRCTGGEGEIRSHRREEGPVAKILSDCGHQSQPKTPLG